MPVIFGMVNKNDAMEKVAPYEDLEQRDQVPVATTYTFTGPTSGTNGVASTAFTVALPAMTVSLPVVITPADAGTGNAGVFAPTSISLDKNTRSGTFTYTPGSTGAKVISVTNVFNGGFNAALTNPANITYTSS